jgi:hypothetical protein
MGKKILPSLIVMCLVLAVTGYAYAQTSAAGSTAPETGASPFNPAPIGVTVADIISCGSGYDSHQTYDIKITLLQIIRGDEAWKRIKAAGPSNEPPKAGLEYMLARVWFGFLARGKPGDCVYELNEEEFAAISSEGKEYKSASVVPPDPKLLGRKLSSGDSVEGWAVFLAGKDDNKPLLTFSRSIWFRLY